MALELTRSQVLAHRRRVGFLDARLTAGEESLERAAYAGLQDSMPRAAVLSAHARVDGVGPYAWEEPPYIQIWGPRFNAYVISERDHAVFTLGRLSDEPEAVKRAYEMVERFEAAFGGARVRLGEVGKAVGTHHNYLRYGAPTGRLQIRWEGSGDTMVWSVSAPEGDQLEARLELARRYLHALGPGTGDGFSDWAGIRAPRARSTIEALVSETLPVVVGGREGVALAADEESLRSAESDPTTVRLLPSGDSYWLLHGEARELVVPDAGRRSELWTSRVWPGALLVAGEIAGIWRRSGHKVTITPWGPLSPDETAAVEEEARSLPLPGLDRDILINWERAG